MKRLTMSLDDALADAFEAIVRDKGYANRSEAFRDLLRQDLGESQLAASPAGPCFATLSYVYDHHQRQLAARLTDLQHDHHELTIATMHAHLDHDHCLETAILQGPADAVRAFAQAVIAQPGVSHGHLHLIPASSPAEQSRAHRHAPGDPHGHAHGHTHLAPATARPRKPKRAR